MKVFYETYRKIEDLLKSYELNTASLEKYNLEQEKLKTENKNSKPYKEEEPEIKDT